MDDEEAEAALLALGGALTWKRWGFYRQIAGFSDMPDVMDYLIDHKKRLRFLRLYDVFVVRHCVFEKDIWEDCPHIFASQATAKAACERHHATGKWK